MEARPSANRVKIGLLLVLSASVFLLPACLGKQQAQPSRDAQAFSMPAEEFGGQWWDFYKRGLYLAERGKQREAMADFQEAVARRDKDEWQAEIDTGRALDYFPHRELGILFVARQEYSKAILALEYSLASAPSAKASFFLNQARTGKTGRDSADRSPPEITFAGSTATEVTSNCRKTLTGVASDDNYVAALSVAGQQLPLELPEKNKIFTTDVVLTVGKNAITAIAADLAGNTAEKKLDIICDRRGPLIEIEELTVENKQVRIRGSVSDDHGLAGLSINGEPWPITGKAAGYNFDFTLPDGRITIVASDRAGNVTGARVRRDESELQAAAIGAMALPRDSGPRDIAPPTVRIDGLGSEVETVADTVQLTGQVSDASLIVYISINGEEIVNRKGKSVFFSQLCPLQEGTNNFRILAADSAGNKSRHTITVIRKVEPGHQAGDRLRLALLPFSGIDATDGQDSEFANRLRSAFLALNRFNLVDEARVIAASRDLHLSPGSPVSPRDASLLARAVGAQAVLTGRVIATGNAVEIVGQLIDPDSGALMARNDVFGQSGKNSDMESLFAGLAAKFSRELPLAEGVILDVRDREVLVDLGTRDRLRPMARLICYREGPPARHPVTGVLLAAEPEVVGELQVTEVNKKSCRAKILEQKGELLRGDKIITR